MLFSLRRMAFVLFAVVAGLHPGVAKAATFSLNKTSYAGGENITASWTRTGAKSLSRTDWIGLYTPSQVPGSSASLRWFYLNNTQTAPAAPVQNGSITFTSPGLAVGSYVARFLRASCQVRDLVTEHLCWEAALRGRAGGEMHTAP